MNKHAKGCTYLNDRSPKEVCVCRGLGKLQRHAIDFYAKYPGWHSFSKSDGLTKRVINSLEQRGLLEVNEHYQARSIA